ncbi:hypothetical protein TorRG33x02_059170 [Trema orientale]|uniref:Uncharacterized protein n=1 Tax=Trema orientale TaxID=63057 RepID=A0A2P5FKL5_TREOI|nr:hypothetical protein TorRG33x02_059170 [Trema orientale]
MGSSGMGFLLCHRRSLKLDSSDSSSAIDELRQLMSWTQSIADNFMLMNEHYDFIITNDEFRESYMEEFRTLEFIEQEKNKQQKTAQTEPKDSASTTTISTRLLEQII